MGKKKHSRAAGQSAGKSSPSTSVTDPQQCLNGLVAAYHAGRYADVVSGATRFTREWPQQEAGWNLLAEGLRMRRSLDQAKAACRQALAINPMSANAHHNAANILRDLGDAGTAEAEYRKAISLRAGQPEPRYNLGNLLLSRGRYDEAVSELHAAAAARPEEPLYHFSLGVALRKLENHPDARTALERARRMMPEHFETCIQLGRTYRDLNEHDKALEVFRKAIELRPDSPKAHCDLGTVLQVTGDLAGAEECGRMALAVRGDHANAWYLIAQSRDFSASDPEIAEMEALVDREGLSDDARSILHFSLGKAHGQATDDPDRVFGHYREACRLKRNSFDYDIARTESFMEEVAEAFSADWMREMSPVGESSEAPVFIIGMPRSGTTMTEQILASHARVHGAGECADLTRLVRSKDYSSGMDFPEWVPEMPVQELALLGEHYRSRVIDPARPAERVVDKMPSNFLYLGLIAKALPNARVIHLRRDPADTCLSCYMQRFTAGAQKWSYDLGELGRYYRAYAQLMDHWQRVLPKGGLLELSYEELVADPETQIQRLLDYCDLEWDPACVDFHRTERAVKTASVSQVRKPIYRSSVGKWRTYEAHLGPLFDALGPLAPQASRSEA